MIVPKTCTKSLLTTIILHRTTYSVLVHRLASFHIQRTFLHNARRPVTDTVAQLARFVRVARHLGSVGVEKIVDGTAVIVQMTDIR